MEYINTSLSERLRLALKVLGISQTELAKRINVKPQIIQYLCASNSEKSKFTFDIAEALKIDVLWLAIGKGELPHQMRQTHNERQIPVLSLSQIIKYKIESKSHNFSDIIEWVSVNNNSEEGSFAVTLNDKSMAPRFNLGTTIIIDENFDLDLVNTGNCFVLVYIAKEDFVVFRQLIIDEGVNTLAPLNNKLYKNIALTEEDVILGLCKEARWSI